MGKKSRFFFFICLFCSLPSGLRAENNGAEPVTIVYDDGLPAGYFDFLKTGDVEAARFTPLHPFKLKEIEIAFAGDTSYEVEVHIWPDNGGHEPDLEKDVIKPLILKPQPGGEFTKITIPNPVAFEPLRNFHVGIIHLSPEPSIMLDKENVPEVRGMVKSVFEGQFQWAATPGDYLVRVSGEYYDKKSGSWFEDITESSGATGGGRLAFGDYDNDGDDDLLVNGNRLFKNIGSGKFEEVTEAAKIGGKPTNGAVWGDFDNDGFLDFYATVNSLTEHDLLYRNNGDGTFSDVSDPAGP
ncbi:MAG: VCBS repeat-containing protein, partial [Deltaproteobacteria bacterium]|nr:VCBS repeat-containing protein [Deltaproteobacteria bacterium]